MGGNSAGAASVTLHLTAYGGRDDGLFHATATESQSFGAMLNVEESQYQYDNLVIRTGCVDEEDTLACLRSLSATFLQENNYNTPSPGAQVAPLFMYGPVIDNDFVQNYTYGAFEQGRFVHLPAIFGYVKPSHNLHPLSHALLRRAFVPLFLSWAARPGEVGGLP